MRMHRTPNQVLKQLRKDSGLTQTQAAKQIGISFSMYSKIENGERVGSNNTLTAIADFFGVSLDFLCGRVTHESWVKSKKQTA